MTLNRALFYGVGMKSAKILVFSAVALILSGCTGYQAGRALDSSVKTVSLSVINKTDEPSIEVAVMKALRAEIQMDGQLAISSQDEADAVLTVTLTRFTLDPLAFNRRQGSLAEEYRMTLSASAVLSYTESNAVIQENPAVRGEAEFSYIADLTSAKRAGMPEAAADLARKVVSSVVTAW